ncbi:MAG: hypothetical protein OXE94_04975 [Aestuariivita sp.]|nr:hypothetical protein [Aestuariivita sp.]MCY4201932.1 hypothetical protein [Aestuariivita sp.]MCY4288818.1 hypothetical protein [Aestuariivita sp.]MCY4345261.1 hypothetical protein [Aestuariivita sp.]
MYRIDTLSDSEAVICGSVGLSKRHKIIRFARFSDGVQPIHRYGGLSAALGA